MVLKGRKNIAKSAKGKGETAPRGQEKAASKNVGGGRTHDVKEPLIDDHRDPGRKALPPTEIAGESCRKKSCQWLCAVKREGMEGRSIHGKS